jgi:hypothetical protein
MKRRLTSIASSLRTIRFEWQEVTRSCSLCPYGMTPRNIMQEWVINAIRSQAEGRLSLIGALLLY